MSAFAETAASIERARELVDSTPRYTIGSGAMPVIASLVAQRKVKRMLRTKAQREADRLGADADALTAALVALGAETEATS